MSTTLRFGKDATLSLDLDADNLVAACDAPRGKPIVDPASAVRQALASPLEFPPLAAAVVPGDRVVLALEPSVPQASVVVAAVVEALVAAEVKPADISILCRAEDSTDDDPRRDLPSELRSKVALISHDPGDREKLSYLASLPEGRPVYLNRSLCEADVVVPIGCLRTHDAVAYQGAYAGLYPLFSDQKTHRRYRNPGLLDSSSEMLARARQEVSSVGWLTGSHFSVQIVPGSGDAWLDVLAGELEHVTRVGQERCDAAWTFRVPRRADLVVASIRGDASQQTWEHLGEALITADKLVEEGGAIALCTELAHEPGPAVAELAAADDLNTALRHIRKQRGEDILSAVELVQVLERSRVYLLSRLDSTLIEDLGLVAIDDPADVARLAQRTPTVTLLADAHRAAVIVESEELA